MRRPRSRPVTRSMKRKRIRRPRTRRCRARRCVPRSRRVSWRERAWALRRYWIRGTGARTTVVRALAGVAGPSPRGQRTAKIAEHDHSPLVGPDLTDEPQPLQALERSFNEDAAQLAWTRGPSPCNRSRSFRPNQLRLLSGCDVMWASGAPNIDRGGLYAA